MKTSTVTRVHPTGSTLTRASGAAIVIGDTVTEGESVTFATPDGSGGCVSLARPGVRLVVRPARFVIAPPVPIAIQPIATEDTGDST